LVAVVLTVGSLSTDILGNVVSVCPDDFVKILICFWNVWNEKNLATLATLRGPFFFT
jgi:hypothetical protein